MTSNQPGAPGYSNLDYVRNLLTVAAAAGLTVFHRDVSAYVPAAAYLVAGVDVVATHLLKGKGGILHRLEAAAASVATTVGQIVHLLPASTPVAVAKDASEAGAVAGELVSLTAAQSPPATVVVNVHPPVPGPSPVSPTAAAPDGADPPAA